MQKESFIFYKSFYDAIKKIPEEYQLELYNAVLSYALEGKEPENLSGVAEAMFILMKPNLDNAEKRYKASVENGKKGGRPRKNENLKKPSNNLNKTQEKPNKNLDKTHQKANQNLNVDDDVDVYVDVNDDVYVDVDADDEIISNSNVIDAYENNIAPITQITLQLLNDYCDTLSPPLVHEAIIKATIANKRSFKYIEGILRDWENKGFKKLIDVKNEEEVFRKSKEKPIQEETKDEKVKRQIKELEERMNANK